MMHLFRQQATCSSVRKVKRVYLLLPVITAVAILVVWTSHASQSLQGPSDYSIKVNVREVLLRATVTDHKGNVVPGLSQDDFHVFENGTAQKIAYFAFEDVPVSVGLVIDASGSMNTKRSEVIAGAKALLHSSNSQDEVFTVNFNERVSFGLPAAVPFTSNTAQLEAALCRLSPKGETALYDAVAAALRHVRDGSRDKKVLIVISDGGDNASKLAWPAIKALVAHSDATIYTIGIFDAQDMDQNPRVLKELARQTGGEAFFPKDLKDLVPVCEQIARDIRNQYTIGYVPAERDEGYRRIEVKAAAKGHGHLSVRTRDGYFAQPSASAGEAAPAAP